MNLEANHERFADHCAGARDDREGVTAPAARALTFDMRGGRKWAKPACGRPLDGRVRPHWATKVCVRIGLPSMMTVNCQFPGTSSNWWSNP